MFWATILHLILPLAIWLALRWRPGRDPGAGPSEVRRYRPLVRLAGWLALILSPVIPMLLAGILQEKRDQDVWLIRSCFACAWLFLVVGLLAWRETGHGFLVLSGESIRRYSPLLGTTVIAWSHVGAVRISPKGIITLTGDNGKLTLIPHVYDDMESIVDAVNQRVDAGAFVGV